MSKTLGDMIKFREQTNFLGYEFLTWLFLKLAGQNLNEVVEKLFVKEHVMLLLGGRLATCLLNHKEQKTTIVCPDLEHSHEVYASLKNGHVIESLSLLLSFEDRKISFILHARDAAFTQVTISNNFDKALSDEDLSEEDKMREEIFLRASSLAEIEMLSEALLAQFFKERLSVGYADSLHLSRQAIENRLNDYLRKGNIGKEVFSSPSPL